MDGDSLINLHEFIAGTDPTDASSYLRIEAPAAGASHQLTFQAVSKRTYTIERTDALGAAPWLKLVEVAARQTNRLETVLDPSPGTNR